MSNNPITSNVREVYRAIKSSKVKYGRFHKTCFHLHTPQSFDYRLFETWDAKDLVSTSQEALLKKCIEKKIVPMGADSDILNFPMYSSSFCDCKEMLEYLLLADALFKAEYELVVVTDHNVLGGTEKLRKAIEIYKKSKYTKTRINIIAGVEISCADKNHVVGIYDDRIPGLITKIENWLKEHLISVESGVYVTSLDTLNFLSSIDCMGYIAHINSSDIISKDSYSFAYKKMLFSADVLKCIGLKDLSTLDVVCAKIDNYRKGIPFAIVLDNDAHDIDSVTHNAFYIKGSTCTINTIREAIIDYDIVISFEEESHSDQYIEGLYIEPTEEGFLCNKPSGPFSLAFSSALNCLIGGRGTGKSTVLDDIIEYMLDQRCNSQQKLNFICKHGNCWLLYQMKDVEYLIEMLYHKDNELYNRIFQQYGYPGYMVNFKSVSKFLFALTVGCMIDDGVIRDAYVPVAELLPEYASQMPVLLKRSLSLHHLLSMSSGFQWNDSGNVFFEWMHSKDWVSFALTRPIASVPGERYCYNTSNIHLVSAIIRKKTGMPALQYIKERLLVPLGIYQIGGQRSPEGNDFGGSELYFAPQDMAKIGRLILQNGVWEKKRILGPKWISICLKEHMRVNEEYGYGYCCFLTEMSISRYSHEKAAV